MGNRDLSWCSCGRGAGRCENIVKIWGDRWSSSHEVGYMWLKCGKIKQKRKDLRQHNIKLHMGGSNVERGRSWANTCTMHWIHSALCT